MTVNNQIVVFTLNKQQYALPIVNVSEIIRVMEVTEVPNVDYYCKGIINLRGSVVPVISLSLRLGLEESELSNESRVVVIEKEEQKLGLIVDSVSSVSLYVDDEIEKPEAMKSSGDFIDGVIHQENNIILLLDMEKIIN